MTTDPETPTAPVPPTITTAARRALRVGWICFAFLPASLVAAMVLGEWLLSRQGYASGEEDLPVSAMLAAGVPAVLVLIAPLVVAAWFGFRAERLGHPGGRALLVVAGIVAAALVALNLLQPLAAWLGL